jgi:transposase
MANHRTHSIEFKRKVAQEFLTGETLHGLSKRHNICRNLIRFWIQKYEAGAFDEDVQTADCSSSMRRGSRRLSGLSASRHWNWSS